MLASHWDEAIFVEFSLDQDTSSGDLACLRQEREATSRKLHYGVCKSQKGRS